MKSKTQTPKTDWSAAEYAICGLAIVMIALGATFAPEFRQLPVSLQLIIATLATIATGATLAFLLSNRVIRQLRRDATDSDNRIIALGERLVSATDIARKRHDVSLKLLEPYFAALKQKYGREGEDLQGWNINGVDFVDTRSFLDKLHKLVEKHGIVKLIELANNGDLPEELMIEDEALAEFVSGRLRAATFS